MTISMKYFSQLLLSNEPGLYRFILQKEILAANRHMVKNKYMPHRNLSIFQTSRNGTMRKEYTGKKLVGYSMEGMFDVVVDVGNYKNFLPFCKQSTVTSRSTNHLTADLAIGFPPIREEYTSNVTFLRPHLVKAVGSECRIIKHLVTVWKFSPGLKNSDKTCIIDFYVSFEFRSSLHSQLANFFFNELVRQMEGAFYQEAKARYGRPTIATQILNVPRSSSTNS